MADTRGNNHTRAATYELRQRIVSGAIEGGTRLFEVALAEELGISRTPVREAMARLAEEGLLDRLRGGGFVVRTFTYRDMIDAIELRGVLEGTAARMAAEQGADPARLSAMKRLLGQLDTCFNLEAYSVDFDRYSELNAEFHRQLADLCESPVIKRELERVTLLPFASPSAFVLGGKDDRRYVQSLFTGQAQHHAILSAIENRESARAESLAREHARTARANLEQALAGDTGAVADSPKLALVAR